MDGAISELKPKRTRKPKAELESRSFKDGAIYLFKRADYVKPTWFCRVKVPGSKGYVSASTKTTDEHQAFAFANELFHKTLGRVHSGQDLHSKRVTSALDEYAADLKRLPTKTSVLLKIQFCERMKAFFKTQRLKDIDTKLLYEFLDWLRENSRKAALSANSAYSDEAGHAFQSEAGHLFRFDAGHPSLLPQVEVDDVLSVGLGQVSVRFTPFSLTRVSAALPAFANSRR